MLDAAVPVEQLRGGDRADARQCRDNRRQRRRRVQDNRESARDRRRTSSRTPLASRDRLAGTVDLHDAIVDDALREILVRRPDADLLDARIVGGDSRGGRERVVGLELDHRPRDDAHRDERILERMELPQQRRLDPLARLVAGPQPVSKRFDDVIGRDADVRRACSIICSTVCSTPATAPYGRSLSSVKRRRP